MPITYRTAGAWGPGTGVDLPAATIDANFYDLDQRLVTIETTPPECVTIDHFVVDGTMLTIVMSDATEHGPFLLPVAQWRFTGEWLPDTTYFVGDIVTNNSNTYFIRVQHVSAATFDPGLFTVDGFVYILILAKASQPYDIGLFFTDVVGSGEDILFQHVVCRELTIAENFDAAQAYLRVACTDSTIAIPIYNNGAVIGTITFAPGVDTDLLGGQYGTFAAVTPDVDISLAIRDILAIGQPYDLDSTAAGLSVTIPAVVASL